MPAREPQPVSDGLDITRTLLTVDEARARILSGIVPLPVVQVNLLDSLGLVLAEDIVAGEHIPPFDNSAMDGYALRSADTATASQSTPVRLTVIGEAAAGHASFGQVDSGSAIRIMTGAPIPCGADAVIRFEDVEVEHSDTPSVAGRAPGGTIRLRTPARAGQNVRLAGEDVLADSLVIRRGTTIRPAHVGLLAALNRESVTVHRRPRVAILATGDEVVDLGSPLEPGQIRNSNSYLLAAMTREIGGEPTILGIARDTAHDITDRLRTNREVDLFVTSGGVSVGDFDVVKRVLQEQGDIELWQVRIKPGKPMAFGKIGDTPLLGLPGNPVAAAVTFAQFGRPLIRRLMGMQEDFLGRLVAELTESISNSPGRRHFVGGVARREDDRFVVRPVGKQGSSALAGLAQANCYIVIHEDQGDVSAGSSVEIQLFNEGCFEQ
jgi:molybdopterin molybdotransferase